MNDQSKTDAGSATSPKGAADALLADAKGVATNLASEAKDVVGKLAGDAKSELEKRITSGKDEAAKAVGGVAEAIRHTAEDLDGTGPLPRLADQAADRIEQVAEYVQSRTIGDLVREVERFARREPAIFLGGSFALGLLGGRFLKSSSSRRMAEQEADERSHRGGRSRETRAERAAGGMTVVRIPGRHERSASADQPVGAERASGRSVAVHDSRASSANDSSTSSSATSSSAPRPKSGNGGAGNANPSSDSRSTSRV